MDRRQVMPSAWLNRQASRVRFIIVALALATLLISSTSVASGMLQIAELVANPGRYDQKVVAVVGHVSRLRMVTNQKGQHFYGFLLKDEDDTLKVVGSGRSPVREGDFIIVEGIFRSQRKVGRLKGLNEIKATFIRPLDRLHPDLVG